MTNDEWVLVSRLSIPHFRFSHSSFGIPHSSFSCRLQGMRPMACAFVLAAAVLSGPGQAQEPPPLRLAVAGLVHGHVDSFIRAAQARKDVTLVGVFESDTRVLQKYAAAVQALRERALHDLESMLDKAKPDAIASFTTTFDHPAVVEAAAARRVHVMMEKPLAVSNAHAQRIRRAAEKGTFRSSSISRPPGIRATARCGSSSRSNGRPARSERWSRWTATAARRRSTFSRISSIGSRDPVRNGGGALVRLRLLRRQPHDVDDGQSTSCRRHRGDAELPTDRLSRRSTTRPRSSSNIQRHRGSSRPLGTGRSAARTSRSTANAGKRSRPAATACASQCRNSPSKPSRWSPCRRTTGTPSRT